MGTYGVLVIITNLIMIPLWGINGAAIASLTSTFCFNLFKYLFLLKQYKLQPFNYKYLLVILISILAYYAGYVMPKLDWFVLDILVRSSLVGVVYLVLTVALKISNDLNQYLRKLLQSCVK